MSGTALLDHLCRITAQQADDADVRARSGKSRDREHARKARAALAAVEAMPAEDRDLRSYDWIVLSSSGGKDSQAQLTHVVDLCDDLQIPRSRIVVVHADLGRVEWQGTRDLARRQAEHYGLRFEVVEAVRADGSQNDLLDRIERRGKWPDAGNRYCTAEFKRGPIRKLHTALGREWKAAGGRGRPCRILDCLGIRGEESTARKRRSPVLPAYDAQGKPQQGTSGRKYVVQVAPIYDWDEGFVWSTIRYSGLPHHRAYDLGMPRLSCVFCVFAPRAALMVAGEHNRALLDQYVEAEARMGHTFRHGFALADIRAALEAGESAELVQLTGTWDM